jgi:hypothetical protein
MTTSLTSWGRRYEPTGGLWEAYGGLQIVRMYVHQRRSVLVRMTADGQRLAKLVLVDVK